jgi:hypothetical protein
MELERLTGCPVNMVIEGRCSEPDCPNAGRVGAIVQPGDPNCHRIQELMRSGGAFVQGDLDFDLAQAEAPRTAERAVLKPEIQLRPQIRCVL